MLSAVFLNLSSLISNCNLALTHLGNTNSSKIQYIFVISPSLFWSLVFSPWTFSEETSLLPLTLIANLYPFSSLVTNQKSWCLQLGPVGHQLESCRYYVIRELFFDDVVSLAMVSSKLVLAGSSCQCASSCSCNYNWIHKVRFSLPSPYINLSYCSFLPLKHI